MEQDHFPTSQELNGKVTEQIMFAERLDDINAPVIERALAWHSVSLTEESIADFEGISEPEKAIAQRGSVMAAEKSGNQERAQKLRTKYGLLEDLTEDESLLAPSVSEPIPKKAETPDDFNAITRSVLETVSNNRSGEWSSDVIRIVQRHMGYELAAVAAVFLELSDQGVIEYSPDTPGAGVVLTEAGRTLFEHYDELMSEKTLESFEPLPPPAEPIRGRNIPIKGKLKR